MLIFSAVSYLYLTRFLLDSYSFLTSFLPAECGISRLFSTTYGEPPDSLLILIPDLKLDPCKSDASQTMHTACHALWGVGILFLFIFFFFNKLYNIKVRAYDPDLYLLWLKLII